MRLQTFEARVVYDEESGWSEVVTATADELALAEGHEETFWAEKVRLGSDAIELRIAEEKAGG